MRGPITRDEVLDAHELLRREHCTLDDFHVPTQIWEMRATCSSHGAIRALVMTYRDPPEQVEVVCKACAEHSTVRTCRVVQLIRITGGYLPTL